MTAQHKTVVLEQSEETELQKIVRSGTHNSRTITRARILLMTNEREEAEYTVSQTHSVLGISRNTVYEVQRRYREGGVNRALYDAPRPGKPKTFTPTDHATVVAIACTDPPDGYGSWTLDLLVKEAIKRIGKTIGRNTVDKILLKNEWKPWLKKNVVYQGDGQGV